MDTLRLKERQLHILFAMLCVASIILFCIFGIRNIPASKKVGNADGMQSFSDAWICTYVTTDAGKIQEELEKSGEKDKKTTQTGSKITEIVNLPATVPVQKGKTLTMTHKLPDDMTDTVYLTMETNHHAVRVYVGQKLLYNSRECDSSIPAYHIIPVSAEYKDKVVTFELYGQTSNEIKIAAIQSGNYNEVLTEAFFENGEFLIIGAILFFLSLGIFLVWILAKNTWQSKRVLLYSGAEGIFLAALFLMDSRLFQVLTGWNYPLYLIKACLIIILAVLHIMVMRCYIYKKKVLLLMDGGILLYGVFYISVMVLQAFSLISFSNIYTMGRILFAVSVLLYTIILAVASYDYRQKDGKLIFAANGMLLLGIAASVVIPLIGKVTVWNNFCIPAGVGIYLLIVWITGLKKAVYIEQEEKDSNDREQELREQIVEQLNPNLLFASFRTLQSLIKSGSSKSVKMIYYISVYIRDNLKAISQAGEIIPFEEELEHIISYLQLQKTRNQNLEFVMECKVKEFRVPRHSIEPIVEKAVKHGIANHDNKGNVVIRSYQRAEGYAVQVIDDGIGFHKSQLKKDSPTALLSLLGVLEQECQAKTEIISKEGKGTVITIILPMLENDLIEEA